MNYCYYGNLKICIMMRALPFSWRNLWKLSREWNVFFVFKCSPGLKWNIKHHSPLDNGFQTEISWLNLTLSTVNKKSREILNWMTAKRRRRQTRKNHLRKIQKVNSIETFFACSIASLLLSSPSQQTAKKLMNIQRLSKHLSAQQVEITLESSLSSPVTVTLGRHWLKTSFWFSFASS